MTKDTKTWGNNTARASESLGFAHKKRLCQRFHTTSFNLWSWRESNPRPNEEIISFLHAYLCLIFRATAEPKPSTVALSSKVSSEPRG